MSSKSIRLWAVGRRIQYGLGFFAVWGLVGTLIYFSNYYQPASCFDQIINGNETGVDCGGDCVRICAAETLPPRVVWAESFKITDGQYNAVAYVENQNQTAATPALDYTFQLFDQDRLIAERSGTTALPPNSVYPVFEGKILIAVDETVTETKLMLKPADMWVPASINRDQFRSVDINLTSADTRPRLDVKLENRELTDAENVEVVATIFNDKDEPVIASRTFVEQIGARSTSDIVFTWPNSIAKTVKNCIIPTDVAVAIDLSGSMNNDGGSPPQPVTDALQAAGQFVNALQKDDRVAVLTFASQANIITELTNQKDTVASTISALEIDKSEETGFTNTVEALRVAQVELNSERHNPDARRVLVLLTDGLPTASGDTDVVKMAQETAETLSDDNIEVYAIGLGEGVDQGFIKNIASQESYAYLARTGSDLKQIYSEITASLCEVGPTKIEVYAKTTTNFAPLR